MKTFEERVFELTNKKFEIAKSGSLGYQISEFKKLATYIEENIKDVSSINTMKEFHETLFSMSALASRIELVKEYMD